LQKIPDATLVIATSASFDKRADKRAHHPAQIAVSHYDYNPTFIDAFKPNRTQITDRILFRIRPGGECPEIVFARQPGSSLSSSVNIPVKGNMPTSRFKKDRWVFEQPIRIDTFTRLKTRVKTWIGLACSPNPDTIWQQGVHTRQNFMLSA
jgi:hypothetical protein